MNLNPYIESGILECYVLHTLSVDEREGVERMLAMHPELKEELNAIEISLETYLVSKEIKPTAYLEERIVGSLLNLIKEKAMKADDLPVINRFSDHKNWLWMLEGLTKVKLDERGRWIKVLRQNDQITQMLIVSTTDIEEETHENEYESFLILSGACKCTIGSNVRLMEAGDYLEIPLHVLHDVALVSERVVAILQLIKS